MGEEQPPSSVCGTANTTGASWVRVDSDGEEDAEQKASRASEAQSVSSICTSRPSSKRSAAHRAKKAAVSMAKAQKKREASGGVWTPTLPRAEYVALQREKMNSMLQELAKLQLTEAEKFDMIREMFAPPQMTTPAPPPVNPSPAGTNDGIVEGECLLCGRYATDEHKNSSLHQQRLDTNLRLNVLAGVPEQPRALFQGFTGELTRRAFAKFWGPDVIHLDVKGKRIISQRGFSVKFGGKKARTYDLTMGDVETVILGAVSYVVGNAKYVNMEYHRWTAIAEGDLTAPGTAPLPPDGTGWWPVIELVLRGNWETPNCVILCCIYQLLEQRPQAWPCDVNQPPPPPRPPLPPLHDEGVWDPPPEPAPRVPVLRLRGTGPPPPPPPTWGNAQQPGAIAAAAEEVD
jgi:hypothetical protein